jgi:hypothetical protein
VQKGQQAHIHLISTERGQPSYCGRPQRTSSHPTACRPPSLHCHRHHHHAMSPPRRHRFVSPVSIVIAWRLSSCGVAWRCVAVVFVLRHVAVVFAQRCVVSVVFTRGRAAVVFVWRRVAVIWVVLSSRSVGQLSSSCGVAWARGGRLRVLEGCRRTAVVFTCCRAAVVFASPSDLLSGQWWGWHQVK